MKTRLTREQQAKLLEWIAEGLETGEINSRAAVLQEPFNVGRSQVDYYRKTRNVRLKQIRQRSDHDQIQRGFALKARRVQVLSNIARLIERELIMQLRKLAHDAKSSIQVSDSKSRSHVFFRSVRKKQWPTL